MSKNVEFKKIGYEELRKALKSGKPVYLEAKLLEQFCFGEYENEPDYGFTAMMGKFKNDIVFDGAEIYQKIDGGVDG